MSIIHTSEYGFYISHYKLIEELYKNINNSELSFHLKPELFKISTPYKNFKQKQQNVDRNETNSFEIEVRKVKEFYNIFRNEIPWKTLLCPNEKNSEALEVADAVYLNSSKCTISDLNGGNLGPSVIKQLQDAKFLFPKNCKFYCRDVKDISKYLTEKYDLILLDPPWWNKYIRRKRKYSDQGYNMLYNDDLKKLPLEEYLNDNGLIVVWCTNSQQHVDSLKNDIFPKWKVQFHGKWYWVKVTTSGEPICEFSKPPRKQPFEQIIFGVNSSRKLPNPICDKIVMSIPSAIHSHKPPLLKLLEPYLPEQPKCLEIFARYLLPGWTSYGKEVLRLQHESLYDEYKKLN